MPQNLFLLLININFMGLKFCKSGLWKKTNNQKVDYFSKFLEKGYSQIQSFLPSST